MDGIHAKNASEKYFNENEDGQAEMFNDEMTIIADALQKMSGSDKYEIKVAITLKPLGDNALPDNIPVIRGKFAKEYIEELIDLAFKSDGFKKRLRAVLGNPSGQLTKELDEARQANQQ